MIECSNNRMLGSEITDPKVKPYANISVFSRIESNSVRRGPKGPRLSFYPLHQQGIYDIIHPEINKIGKKKEGKVK